MRLLACSFVIGSVLSVLATARAQDAASDPAPIAEAPPTTEAPPAADDVAPPDARVPKVAIVVAGDPDPATLAAVAALEHILETDARVTMPSDPAMRAALAGGGADDGLDEVRAERRHLGLGEARDAPHLTVLGEVTGADLVLVVRAAHGAIAATAFDVLRRSFYEGAIALEPIDVDEATHFVFSRARRAARPLAPDETSAVPDPPPPVVDPSTAVPPEAIAADPAPAHEPDFFEQYWPYFAAGALLVGAVVFIVLTTQSNSTPPPVLRFEVGGGS